MSEDAKKEAEAAETKWGEQEESARILREELVGHITALQQKVDENARQAVKMSEEAKEKEDIRRAAAKERKRGEQAQARKALQDSLEGKILQLEEKTNDWGSYSDFKLSELQKAADAPTFNTSHFPASFFPKHAGLRSLDVEGRFDESVVADLQARGHAVTVGDDWSQGRLCAVARDHDLLKSASSARFTQGYAMGR